jgi:predicted dehydrogenase
MANAKLRCAVAGLGLGRVWTKLVHESPECELVGLIDVDEARLAQVGAEYGLSGDSLFTDYDKALASLAADVVIVVTPPAAHKDNVLAALGAGFHVLSEKPLAANIEEARAMAAAIRGADRKFMVSQNYRWTESVATVRQAIRDGAIGEIGYISLGFHKGFRFGGWREQLPDVLLEDMSIHHFDLLRHLTGRNCRRIYAKSFRPHWSWFDGKPGASVLLELDGGIEVSYFGSWTSRGRETSWAGEWRIVGEKGAIHWDSPNASLVLGHPEENPQQPPLDTLALLPKTLEHSGFAYSLHEFVRAIEEDREPVTGIDDNLQSFAMAMAAIESARSGRAIDVQEYIAG